MGMSMFDGIHTYIPSTHMTYDSSIDIHMFPTSMLYKNDGQTILSVVCARC